MDNNRLHGGNRDGETLLGRLDIGNDTIVTEDGVGGDTAHGGLGSDTCTVDASGTTSGC